MNRPHELAGASTRRLASTRKAAAASFIGTALESYDFLLYASAAALVFGKVFFGTSDPTIGVLLAFGTYFSGFLARPLGGVIAGHYGDKLGRRPLLIVTLIVMGVSTFLVGVLPTFAQVGLWAPAMLTLLRIVQGFAYGGEWGGAALMVVEYSPPGRRGFWGSFPAAAVPLGLVAATGALAASKAISGDQFLVWGWRIPFLIAVLPVAVGLYIRLKLEETPVYRQDVQSKRTPERMPVLLALKTYRRQIPLAAGVFIFISGPYYIIVSFLLSYGVSRLGVEQNVMLGGVSIGCVVQIFSCIAFGALSDRIGRRPVMLGGGIVLLIWTYPMFLLVNTSNPGFIWLAMGVALVAFGAIYGPTAAYFTELFSTRVRYSAASLGYQFGQVLGGGLAPLLSTAFLAAAGGAYWPVPTYMIVMIVIGLASVWALGETYRTDITRAEGEPVAKTAVHQATSSTGGVRANPYEE